MVMGLKIARKSYALGAEVTGIDLRKPLSPQTVEHLRQAWAEHLVLVFPEQRLTPDEHMRFAESFGQPVDFPESSLAYPGYPQIFVLATHHPDGSLAETRRIAAKWHTDLTFTKSPALGSVLNCVAMPEIGGTTIFANACLAYERLSPTMADRLEGLYVAHSTAATPYRRKMANPGPEPVPVAHRLVQSHPVNGRRFLAVSESTSLNIVGMTEDESDAMLKFLFAHVTKVEFTHRHYWKTGDILMWDNRAAIHMAVADNAYEQPRLLHRVTLRGPEIGRNVDDVLGEIGRRPEAVA
jgi:taurine dioxygenase